MARNQVQQDRIQIEIEVNGRKVENTYKSLNKAAKDLRRTINATEIGGEEWEKANKQLTAVLDRMREAREAARNLGKEQTALGRITDKLKGAFGNFGGLLSKAFAPLAALGAAAGLVEFAKRIGQTAVELESFQRRAEIVFGESIGYVEQFAKRNARAMGLTRSEYLAAATSAGDLLIPLEFQRDEAARLSVELTDLSGALAEWSGGQVDARETSEILTKALLGEREQLKTLGIAILESDVQARLAAKGQKELTGAALEQAKALVTLELIQEKSADAQTAFATSSGNLARSQAQIGATWRDLSQRAARALIPTIAKVLDTVNELTGGTSKYSDELERERFELNILAGRIFETNEGTDERRKLIDELNARYPDFLDNLDAETLTNAELASRLTEVNQQYVAKIALQIKEEELVEKQRKAAEAQLKVFDREQRIRAEIQRAQEKGLVTFDQEASLQDKISAVREEYLRRDLQFRTDIARAGGGGGVGIQTPYSQFFEDVSNLTNAQNSLTEATEEANKVLALREELARSLGIDLSTPDRTQASTTRPTSPSGRDTEAEKAAERARQDQLAALRNLEELRIALLEEGAEKEIALINLRAQREVEALRGTAEQIAEQATLIEIVRGEDVLQVRTKYARLAQDAEDEAAEKRLATDQANLDKALALLDTFEKRRRADVTQAAAERIGQGEDAATTAENLQEELTRIELEGLEARLALLEQYGVDTAALREEIARRQIEAADQPTQGTQDTPPPGLPPLEEYADQVVATTRQIVGAINAVEAKGLADAISRIEARRDAAIAAAGDDVEAREAAERSYQLSREQIETEAAKKRKDRAIKLAILDGASAILRISAQTPFPANLPLILFQIGQTAAQIATMRAQQFALGGLLPGRGGVPRGPRHARGGIILTDSRSGQRVGEAEGGEPILSRATYRNNRPLVDRLLYSSMYQGGAPIYETGGRLPAPGTIPADDTVRAALPDLTALEREMAGMRQDLRQIRIVLRIGEQEVDQVTEMQGDLARRRQGTG